MTSYIDTEHVCSHLKKKLFEENGLREPQFIQEDDFRVIIWRKESNGVEQTSNGVESKSNGVTVKLTAKQKAVIEYCQSTPRTSC